jgi:aminoglycoside 3-N-acetyltransferase
MNSDYTRSEIVESLRNAGIEDGDSVFSHNNLGFFGTLDGAGSKKEYCETFYGAIRDVIGDSGTFVVPTFTYSFTDGDFFDPAETASDMGMLSEYVRTHPDSSRSPDPNFSVAAIGPKAEYFTTDLSTHSFGRNSFWERFLAVAGTFCNLNFDAASSFLHYVERCLNVSYRWDKPFAGTIRRGDSEDARVFYHFVRDLQEEDHAPDFAAFDEYATQRGVVDRTNLGKGQIVKISAQDMYDITEDRYLEDPSFLISGSVH